MDLSKSEMEDIWLNKPVGYFQNLKKRLKSTKKYKIRLSPYTRNYLPEETFEVRAKNVEDAKMLARTEYVKNHKDLHPDAWIYRLVS